MMYTGEGAPHVPDQAQRGAPCQSGPETVVFVSITTRMMLPPFCSRGFDFDSANCLLKRVGKLRVRDKVCVGQAFKKSDQIGNF